MAGIIQETIPNVKDNLVNALQLEKLRKRDRKTSDLITASIEQRAKSLTSFNFGAWIRFSRLKLKVLMAIIPIIVLFMLLISIPEIVKLSTERVLNYNKTYIKPGPFNFILHDLNLVGYQFSDYTLKVSTAGERLPSEVYIRTESGVFTMIAEERGVFSYTFRNLQKGFDFWLEAGSVKSQVWSLIVYPKPKFIRERVSVDAPSYTNLKKEYYENLTDITVITGSVVKWMFETNDVSDVYFLNNEEDRKERFVQKGINKFEYEKFISGECSYMVSIRNEYMETCDSIVYKVKVQDDFFPQLFIVKQVDTGLNNYAFFDGRASDDFGVTGVNYNYCIGESKECNYKKVELKKNNDNPQVYFDLSFRLDTFSLKEGEKVFIYFEAIDNDIISGPKVSRSEIFEIDVLTNSDYKLHVNKNNEEYLLRIAELREDLKQNIEELKKFQQEIRVMEELQWEEKEKGKELFEKHKNILNELEILNKEKRRIDSYEKEKLERSERILEKQEKLDEMFNELIEENTEKMLQEFEKFLEEMDPDSFKLATKALEEKADDLEKNLEKELEFLKQLEVEKGLDEVLNDLKELSNELKKLKSETNLRNNNRDSTVAALEEKKEKFLQIEKKLQDLRELNKELKRELSRPDTEKQEEQVLEKIEGARNNIEQGNEKRASEFQDRALESVEEIISLLQKALQENIVQNYEEDLSSLRQILDNLIKVSFDQEDLLSRTESISVLDPDYPKLIVEQNGLYNELKFIDDSLKALARRQILIESYVDEEVKSSESNIKSSINSLSERNQRVAMMHQQYALTGLNNLAVMLEEVLRKLQEKLNIENQMMGGGQCKKPGPGKSTSSAVKDLQSEFSEMLKKLKDGLGQDGKKGMKGGKVTSERIARMAAQQERIRNMAQEYLEGLKREGLTDYNLQRAIEEMEKTELDLVRRQVTQETIERQNEIEIRLLKSEKAQMLREMEESRESSETLDINSRNNSIISKYKRSKSERTLELFKKEIKLDNIYKRESTNYLLDFK